MRYGPFSSVADAEVYLGKIRDPDRRAQTRRELGLPDASPSRDPDANYLPASQSNGYSVEAEFQAAVVKELAAFGWHVQESLKGSERGGEVWYGKGWPDLQVYRAPRRTFYLELKQPGKKPSQAQLDCHARLRESGYRVTVAYTLDQALRAAQEELTCET
ncbi:VRR-NUC domain-containing protein [Deinococcus radiotolerans]|nr:VRR-NUC domain-containing protein [Deinococcus radiotolerans]